MADAAAATNDGRLKKRRCSRFSINSPSFRANISSTLTYREIRCAHPQTRDNASRLEQIKEERAKKSASCPAERTEDIIPRIKDFRD